MAVEQPPMTDELLREIAAEASADPTSVLRRLVGLPVRGKAGERVDQALVARGLKEAERGEKG